MVRAFHLPSTGLAEQVVSHLVQHLHTPTPLQANSCSTASSPSLCSLPACMAPQGTAHIPGSCPTSWLCAWLLSTPAMKSSSTGQWSCSGSGNVLPKRVDCHPSLVGRWISCCYHDLVLFVGWCSPLVWTQPWGRTEMDNDAWHQ